LTLIGGAHYIKDGFLTETDGVYDRVNASLGGGIYTHNGSYSAVNVLFTGSIAYIGGAIYQESQSSLNLSNSNFLVK